MKISYFSLNSYQVGNLIRIGSKYIGGEVQTMPN